LVNSLIEERSQGDASVTLEYRTDVQEEVGLEKGLICAVVRPDAEYAGVIAVAEA